MTPSGNASTNYSYNGVGSRVSKSGAGGARSYKRDGVGVTSPVLSDGVATMVPGLAEKSGGVTATVHSDRLGSMKALSNGGTVTDTALYDAFGKVTNRTGSNSTQKGFAGNLGYQEDNESGLKLLGHRYYDAEVGRFITRDPAFDGRNWYAYCGNNPLNFVDPSGLNAITDCAFSAWGIVKGFAGSFNPISSAAGLLEGAKNNGATNLLLLLIALKNDADTIWTTDDPDEYGKAIGRYLALIFQVVAGAKGAGAMVGGFKAGPPSAAGLAGFDLETTSSGGRLGSPSHRGVARDIGAGVTESGGRVNSGGGKPESGLRTDAGIRFLDVDATNAQGVREGYQVGKVSKGNGKYAKKGWPVPREWWPAGDILDTGEFPYGIPFIPYQ